MRRALFLLFDLLILAALALAWARLPAEREYRQPANLYLGDDDGQELEATRYDDYDALGFPP